LSGRREKILGLFHGRLDFLLLFGQEADRECTQVFKSKQLIGHA
jgi:hypothetical protein